jgi:hypothetical protein
VERSPLDTSVVYERGIPSDIAVRWLDGKVVPFSKRDEEEVARRYRSEDLAKRSNVREQDPSQSLDGNITPFGSKTKRSEGRWVARNFGRRR